MSRRKDQEGDGEDANFELDTTEPSSMMELMARLTRDLKGAARMMSTREARYLCDLYYAVQDFRIQGAGQTRASGEGGEPNALVSWIGGNFKTLESDIKRAMDAYSDTQVPGLWAKSVVGIGPILAGGLLAHIDIDRQTNVGRLWAFAGLSPTIKWSKGQKRPWNARLKLLAFKIGESFVKVQNNKNDFYGHLFAERKLYEIARNERGELADQAANVLATRNIGKDTIAYSHYSEGRLPPAHIHARARRWTAKLFLSHFWEVSYEARYGYQAEQPWVFVYADPVHTHYIPPPLWPIEGMAIPVNKQEPPEPSEV